jgi:flavin reductase (DIM6/NTAB) family NADH-FMN oxidoreductase RutF
LPAKIALTRCYRPVYPTPAALVTSIAADGRPNVITLGEVFNISIEDPVIVGIAIRPQRYSHELIRRSGEFVVNLPTIAIAEKVTACGRCSGREVDKFALTGLTAVPATVVRPPLIDECPVNLECRLLDVRTIGDHDLFTGEVLVQHVNADVLAEDGSIDASKVQGFALILGQFRAIGDAI